MTFGEIPAAVWGAIAAAWLGMTGWFMKRHFAYGERLGVVEQKVDDLLQSNRDEHKLMIDLIKEMKK